MSRDARNTRNLRKQILNELQKYLEVSESQFRSTVKFLWIKAKVGKSLTSSGRTYHLLLTPVKLRVSGTQRCFLSVYCRNAYTRKS